MRTQTEKYDEARRRICKPSLRKGQTVMRHARINIEAFSRNHFCHFRAIDITYSECVFVALGIQHAMRMRHIAICGLPVVQHFFTLSHKGYDFREKSY
jgi:hypothetical protein